jgi:DNA replication protein DnaC
VDTPRVLLEHYLKQLRLPTVLREFPKLAEQCAKEGTTFEQFLLRLVEQEMLDRERRATERRIRAAKFPVSKSLETYDFRLCAGIRQPARKASFLRAVAVG